MGGYQSIRKISFEDLTDTVFKNKHMYVIINTLSHHEQDCLIENTLPAGMEEQVVNQLLATNKGMSIVLYGKNTGDDSVSRKYQQLNKLGFTNIYVYLGGLFEWLVMQEIYGDEMFPTTAKPRDLYAYRSPKILFPGSQQIQQGGFFSHI